MSDKHSTEIDAQDLANLRAGPDALSMITALLGIEEMAPADQFRTKDEVKAYIASGNADEARAIIQHAKSRRDLWERESDTEEFPESEAV
jgi:hypothetical protein